MPITTGKLSAMVFLLHSASLSVKGHQSPKLLLAFCLSRRRECPDGSIDFVGAREREQAVQRSVRRSWRERFRCAVLELARELVVRHRRAWMPALTITRALARHTAEAPRDWCTSLAMRMVRAISPP